MRNLHEGSIFSICVLKNGNIITGGGKDGKILYFDASLNLTGEEAQASPRNLNLRRNLIAIICFLFNFINIFSNTKRIIIQICSIDRGSFRRNSNALGRKGHSVINRHDEKLYSRWRKWNGFQSRNAGPRRGSLGTCGPSDFASVRHRRTRQIVADVGQFKSYRGVE